MLLVLHDVVARDSAAACPRLSARGKNKGVSVMLEAGADTCNAQGEG